MKNVKAKDLLFWFGEFMRDSRKKKEKQESVYPRGYEKPGVSNGELHLRAFLYVAKHPKFDLYRNVILQIWFEQDKTDTMAMERCSEFEMALDAHLEKVGFVADHQPEEAENKMYAHFPISLVSMALGVSPMTVHRWISKGLSGQLYGGCPAVSKQGAYYYVNYWAARDWKETHGRKFKKEC